MMQKPDVEHIDGLSPAISIEQKTTSRNPRSTVATVTEIYDYMRLLWARVGIPYSPATGLPIEAQTVSQMVDRVMALPEGSRHYLLAPVVRGRKGEYRKELAEWQKAGFTRVRIDGVFYAIEEAPALDKKYKHDIEVVVDRIVVREGIEARLADSFETGAEARRGPGLSRPGRSSPLREGPGVERAATRTPQPRPLPRRGAGSRHEARLRRPRPHHLLREIRLPGLRLHHRRDRAAPVLASTRRRAPARPATASARSWCSTRTSSSPTTRSSIKKGAVVPWAKSNPPSPLLHAGAAQPRPRLRLRPRHARGTTCPRKRSDVILHGTNGRAGHPALHRRQAQLRGEEAVRGRHRQPQPPHAPDRIRLDARGAQPLPVVAARARSATAPASSPRRSR